MQHKNIYFYQMGSFVFKALSYFKYLIKRKDEHSIHSPFVFNFYNHVIKNTRQFYSFNEIEKIRKELLDNNQEIEKIDFGASGKNGKRKISDLAKNSKAPEYGRILFRLTDFFNCNNVIEIGTSLGISGSYIKMANKKSNFYTLEGCPNTARIARENFDKLKLNNVKINIGEFNYSLENLLKKLNTIDLIFFDGNHTFEATIKYFNLAIDYIHNDSVFVFDDIYWSKEMSMAWNEIKNHPKVKITIDLFELGIVFFREQQKEKQHYTLKI
jgi:predicted O-methyltransferase YrrM